jgi:hypothetical protein
VPVPASVVTGAKALPVALTTRTRWLKVSLTKRRPAPTATECGKLSAVERPGRPSGTEPGPAPAPAAALAATSGTAAATASSVGRIDTFVSMTAAPVGRPLAVKQVVE